jgi:hypothetical protein
MNSGHFRIDLTEHSKEALKTAQTMKDFMEHYELASNMAPEDRKKLGSFWSGYIHTKFNDQAHALYSIELMYGWSTFRIATLILVPLIASPLVGILYAHFKGDITAAWTIAIYIETCVLGASSFIK